MTGFVLGARDPCRQRCPYCHAALSALPFVLCAGCGTPLHHECLTQHGRCPIRGCEQPALLAVVVVAPGAPPPALASWEEFVREAQPWLELGDALRERGMWSVYVEADALEEAVDALSEHFSSSSRGASGRDPESGSA